MVFRELSPGPICRSSNTNPNPKVDLPESSKTGVVTTTTVTPRNRPRPVAPKRQNQQLNGVDVKGWIQPLQDLTNESEKSGVTTDSAKLAESKISCANDIQFVRIMI